ncbi:MAG: carboxypeptidase-like regulatory domain-containing protein [Candidatus Korobacteraceae bacterium]
MKTSRLLLMLLAAALLSANLMASDKKDEGPQSSLSFVVLKDDNGKPIRNAAVVLHPVGQHGKQAKGGFELKTDNDGKTHFDGIPYGTLRVQVIADGFQTFGSDYNVNQAEQEITIRLKRPQGQYSIYDKHDGSGGSGSSTPPSSTPPK